MVSAAGMHEIAFPQIDAGVANLATLGIPEIEPVARLQILQPRDRLADQGLLGRCAREPHAYLAVKGLHEA